MVITHLILEFIRALIWPGVVVTLAVVFRDPLCALIRRVKNAKLPGGVAIDFQEEIRDGRELSRDVREAPPPERAKGRASIPLTEANARMLSLGLQPTPSGLDMTYYRDLAEQDPNIALAGLRMELEILTHNVARGFDVPVKRKQSMSAVIRELRKKHAITSAQNELLTKVTWLCNAAVHGTKVSSKEAESVIEMAQVLIDQYLSWLSWGFDDGWSPTEGSK